MELNLSFGEAINLLAILGLGVGMMLRYERRLTRLETHLLHLLPKRRSDTAENV